MTEHLPKRCPNIDNCREEVSDSTYEVRCNLSDGWARCSILPIRFKVRVNKTPKEWDIEKIAKVL